MRAAQRLRGDSSRRRAFFALGVALLRGIRCSGGAAAAHVPPCFAQSREPPARTAAFAAHGRCAAGENGRLLEKTRENRRKSPRLFSKSPQCPSRRRPYTVRPFLLCRNRSGAVRAKTRAPPAVCLCRRLRCGEIAVIRRGKSESPLVRFDAKV